MLRAAQTLTPASQKARLDRALSLFTDVRPGEGLTAVLMLLNIFTLLVCYSVIKTIREPLILLGGGAEVRSYAAAGQALLLMGVVPLYSWFASRVDRARLLIGVTLASIVAIELFAAAVTARVPYVGVAFFIWVGIFNISLIAQFWSFANDVYSKDAGDRLFPIIMVGMTAGAPLGSLIAARFFRAAVAPQLTLQVAAALLLVSIALYVWINSREQRRNAAPAPMLSAGDGFKLVFSSRYLTLIAVLVVLLNVVNTTGEYLIARLLTAEVSQLAAVNPGFDKQAYIGAFAGNYQFWVNVTALLIQAFVTSRLVKYAGLRGALLALPLIALGGYGIAAAGVGFSVVRWIKTAENATDYSVMNTARQLLWLPTTREEKYKAKQAIDTFFVRGGDLVSAIAVYLGASVLHLSVQQFAIGNIVLTLVWLGVALMILQPQWRAPRVVFKPLVAGAAVAMMLVVATPAVAQRTREGELAAKQAEKAANLHPYEARGLERQLERIDAMLVSKKPLYPFIGSAFEGGGIALGPAYRARFGDSGRFDAHAAVSLKQVKVADARATLPALAGGRVNLELRARWQDAPDVAFYGLGNDTLPAERRGLEYRATTAGLSTRVQLARMLAAGGGVDAIDMQSDVVRPAYLNTRLFAEIDTRTAARYTRSGSLYRVEWSDYHQINQGASSFGRVDAEVQHYVPVLRGNWVIALRALASATTTAGGDAVPVVLMPSLGGSHALRGYPAWRFRDRNRLLLTGEYRWTAGPFVDMALFLDAGKVASRVKGLDFDDLKKSYGIGLTLHTLTSTITRIELARTGEGNSLALSFGPSF
jgi:AAA family ATP:ADP antiporter